MLSDLIAQITQYKKDIDFCLEQLSKLDNNTINEEHIKYIQINANDMEEDIEFLKDNTIELLDKLKEE